MTKGISLHVGVNFTNVSSTSLLGCVNDANEMAVIAEQHGFEEHEVIADTQATFDYVTNKIKLAATELAVYERRYRQSTALRACRRPARESAAKGRSLFHLSAASATNPSFGQALHCEPTPLSPIELLY